ncbi:MAG: hypothetical protein D3910_13730 [Candidatus Electrothrix sp. ATG2]|nr:hypothetical protein [Candidatus Electrothrix sp. ATG2]
MTAGQNRKRLTAFPAHASITFNNSDIFFQRFVDIFFHFTNRLAIAHGIKIEKSNLGIPGLC